MARTFVHDRCIARRFQKLLQGWCRFFDHKTGGLSDIGDMGALALICGLFIGFPALIGFLGSRTRR